MRLCNLLTLVRSECIELAHGEGRGLKVRAAKVLSRIGNAYDSCVLRESGIYADWSVGLTRRFRYPPVRLLRVSFTPHERVGIPKSEYTVPADETLLRFTASWSLEKGKKEGDTQATSTDDLLKNIRSPRIAISSYSN